MINFETAENALKTVYLGVVSNQLNINANPLLGKIEQSTKDVWGKEVRKMAPFGISGGIGAGIEDGTLPTAKAMGTVQFVSTLKNLYGSLKITDKALRASSNSAGAFVNLLNNEMENLIKSSAFNLSRMLYGDGSGKLCTVSSFSSSDNTHIVVDSCKNLMEGMLVDVIDTTNGTKTLQRLNILAIDRNTNTLTISTPILKELTTNHIMVVQGSYQNEITGLEALFNTDTPTIYGVSKEENPWLNPYVKTSVGAISDDKIQEAVDYLEEYHGSTIDFITCSSKVRRLYQAYLATYRRNVDVLELAGGHKAISFNGIPVIADRFAGEQDMYLLNTKEFCMHQLCDWQWLETANGRILKMSDNYPTYTATLVKYAEMICDKPAGQAKLTGITEA